LLLHIDKKGRVQGLGHTKEYHDTGESTAEIQLH
jgi:hypothetical protein